MRMVDAKKEIENKLFVGAPLSTDTMLAAYFAITSYIQEHGEDCDVSVDITVNDTIKSSATKKLIDELDVPAYDAESLVDELDARRLIINVEEN